MCDCGCESQKPDGYRSYSSSDARSSPGRRHPDRATTSTHRPNTSIDARRILTYDDEDDDYTISRQCCPGNPATSTEYARPSSTRAQTMSSFGSFRGLNGCLDLSKVPGLAIVQRPMTNLNGSMDYAGAVRRENLSGRSNGSQKYRAALPPRGRTPCCQDDQPSPKARGCCQASRRN